MDTVAQLVDDFAVLDDWEDRYRHVIELGRGLPPLAEARHVAANKVMGCASQVWIISETSGPQQNPVLHFTGDSDALIVKGLIAVAFIIYSDKPALDILATDSAAILKQLGLSEHLTPQRSNGFASMLARIRADAAAALQASSATGTFGR